MSAARARMALIALNRTGIASAAGGTNHMDETQRRAAASPSVRRLKPGPHRTRQRCSGPVCDRPSASRPVPSLQNRLQRRWRRF